ncbi:TlyA family RNA methyltransferase [Clostridia bacterium]|nr:TlyA family RNA methyltransferase [Clostridia bacterium]
MEKSRIDQLLVERGLFSSRQRAKAEIMAGNVLVNDQVVDKAGTLVAVNAEIRISGNSVPFVSRGGLKLDKARTEFNLDLQDKVVADIGASTGGFTDVSLINGAAKVYAVDVGYGQLAWSLRKDSRVVVMERTNARYLELKDIGEPVDLVVTDVSFISLAKIFPAAARILKDDGEMVALIKPQFEAGKENVGKKGVVSDFDIHKLVIERVLYFSKEEGFQFQNLSFSPITGPKGNIEYLLYLVKNHQNNEKLDLDSKIQSVINEAKKLRK